MDRVELKQDRRRYFDRLFNNLAWRQSRAKLTLDDGKELIGREILLPLSPSDDRRLMPTRQGRLCNTYDYRAWLCRARECLRIYQLVPYPKDQPLFVYTLVVMPNNRSDHHNFQKALYDSFEQSGCVLTNDRQIVERHTKGMVIKGMAFTLSYVFPADQPIGEFKSDILNLTGVIERILDGDGKRGIS